jgi:chromosomal replication initiator protein
MSHQEAELLWDRLQNELVERTDTNNQIANAYFSYLVAHSLTDDTLVLSTRLSYVKQFIEGRYLPILNQVLSDTLRSPYQILIVESDIDDASGRRGRESAAAYYGSQAADIDGATDKGRLTQPYDTSLTDGRRGSVSSSHYVEPPADRQPLMQDVLPQQALMAPAPGAMGAAAPLISQVAFSEPSHPSQQDHGPGAQGAHAALAAQEPEFSNVDKSMKTFETYVVGESNKFAYSAAQGAAETPGQRFNPLFIYGKSGLGKTHLLLAVKDYVSHCHPHLKVIYSQTSEFVNDFTSAMASIDKDLTEFRIKYYMCDVLLLDDVQYLEGKDSTTNALFDIFNLFIAQGKQIVLSADRAPNEINLDERYTSRFAQGFTAGIQAPSFEMKMAIFNNLKRYYCTVHGIDDFELPDNITDHIIEMSGSNIRELAGATSNIVGSVAFKDIERRGVSGGPGSDGPLLTIDEVDQIVGMVFLKNTKQIDIRLIQHEVEGYFNISHADMLGPRRSKDISHPRQIAMYLSRRLTMKSYPDIGKLFGKDHSTVIYAIKNIENSMMKDLSMKNEIERLAERIVS